jgi:hypothetical protein
MSGRLRERIMKLGSVHASTEGHTAARARTISIRKEGKA